MNPKRYRYVAVDVSKDTLEVLAEGKPFTCANNERAMPELFDKISKLADPLVAFEATGGYERLLIEQARRRGVPFALLNPARVVKLPRFAGQRWPSSRFSG